LKTPQKKQTRSTLCRQSYTPALMEEFQDFAILDYRVNMRLDNLPLAEITKFYYDDKPDQTMQTYNLGVPLGAKLHEELHADEAVCVCLCIQDLRSPSLYLSLSTPRMCVCVCVCVCVYVCVCVCVRHCLCQSTSHPPKLFFF
jgi:hypothetical protein